MSEKIHTIVLIENYWGGYVQSIAWFAALAVFMWFAVYIGSSAMQWVMALAWLAACVSHFTGKALSSRKKPDDAIAEIQRIKEESQ